MGSPHRRIGMKMKTKIHNLIRHVYAMVPLGSVGQAQQSPFLSNLFNPETTSLATFFNTLFKAAIIVGAMLAVLRLGYAGFVYMTTDLPGAKGNARSIIGNAVLGLLLLLSVWLILNQINPQILNLNILQNVPQPSRIETPSQPNTSDDGFGSACPAGQAWDGERCSSSLNEATCAGFGGRADPSYGSGACVFPSSGARRPAGSWCFGDVCYNSQAACNAGRSGQGLIMGTISNPCSQT